MKQTIEGNYEGAPWAEIFIRNCFKMHDSELWEVHASVTRLQPEDHELVLLSFYYFFYFIIYFIFY